MALFVYVTEECLEEAKRHGITKRIEKIVETLSEGQRIVGFDRFPDSFLKKRINQLRLVAEEKIKDNHKIIILRELFSRDSDKYKEFYSAREIYANKHYKKQISEKELIIWLSKQIENEGKREKKPNLSDYERRYLWPMSEDESYDISICESEAWVKKSKTEQFTNRLESITNLIMMIEKDENNQNIFKNSGIIIYGRKFEKYRKIFLAAIFFEDSEDELINLDESFRYGSILLNDINNIVMEDISRNTYKTFDYDRIADIDIYAKIEGNDFSYLALSNEESEVLESVLETLDKKAEGFPLFINGRAGSGKSTVLQYLFSKYLNIYINLPEGAPPLYLACNDKLIDNARKIVLEIIGEKHKKKENLEKIYDECFKEFSKYLFSMLKPEEHKKFPKEKYVDYRRFTEIWNEKFSHNTTAQKEFPADISWHVIRTYIKGYSQNYREKNGQLEPAEYIELPSKEQSVSAKTYNAIYKNVWLNLYNSDEYWDSQDLTVYILNNKRVKAIHPAIFADESQDFTKIELELIMNMSIYSNRTISTQEIKRLPFAFAGDPFQTLNPTGFRWESIKSMFKTIFVDNLDVTGELKKYSINYRELSFNFRSSKGIVGFSNVIQLARRNAFEMTSVKPQKCWEEVENYFRPAFLNLGIASALRENEDIIILLPCEKGQEYEYYSKDKFLQEARDCMDVEGGKVPRNIFSPANVKGLEFDRVALYKFGSEDNAIGFYKHLLSDDTKYDKETVKLSQEYFINKFYVSATRAKIQLYVIDENEKYNMFYKLFHNPNIQEKFLSEIKNNVEWKKNLLSTLEKADEIVSPEDSLESNIEQANRFNVIGMENKEVYILRQAAMGYDRENMHTQSLKCRAYANLFDNNYKKAYEQFLTTKSYYEAYGSALMAGGLFNNLIEISKKEPTLSSIYFTKIARLLKDNINVDLLKSVLKDIDNISEKNKINELTKKFKIDLFEYQIKNIIDVSIRKLLTKCINDLKASTINKIMVADILLRHKIIQNGGLSISNIAFLHLKAEKYSESIVEYKKINKMSKEDNNYYEEALTKNFETLIKKGIDTKTENRQETFLLIKAYTNLNKVDKATIEYKNLLKEMKENEKVESLLKFVHNRKYFKSFMSEFLYNLFINNEYKELLYISRNKHYSRSKEELNIIMKRTYNANIKEFNNKLLNYLVNIKLPNNFKKYNSNLEKFLDHFIKYINWNETSDIIKLSKLYERLNNNEKVISFYQKVLENNNDPNIRKKIIEDKTLRELKSMRLVKMTDEERRTKINNIKKELGEVGTKFDNLKLAKNDRDFYRNLENRGKISNKGTIGKDIEGENQEDSGKQSIITSKKIEISVGEYKMIYITGEKIKLYISDDCDVSIFLKRKECKSVDVEITGTLKEGFRITGKNIEVKFKETDECIILFNEYGIKQNFSIN